ncbi:hypothetical protein DL93DRAFT_1958579 [Clavulina sp. PMI_390]|nr:hypothetical protein DL93DRAFT_1958579 [Clavulina sp. PMI_390]
MPVGNWLTIVTLILRCFYLLPSTYPTRCLLRLQTTRIAELADARLGIRQHPDCSVFRAGEVSWGCPGQMLTMIRLPAAVAFSGAFFGKPSHLLFSMLSEPELCASCIPEAGYPTFSPLHVIHFLSSSFTTSLTKIFRVERGPILFSSLAGGLVASRPSPRAF